MAAAVKVAPVAPEPDRESMTLAVETMTEAVNVIALISRGDLDGADAALKRQAVGGRLMAPLAGAQQVRLGLEAFR